MSRRNRNNRQQQNENERRNRQRLRDQVFGEVREIMDVVPISQDPHLNQIVLGYARNRLRNGSAVTRFIDRDSLAYMQNDALAREHDALLEQYDGESAIYDLRPINPELDGVAQTRVIKVTFDGTYAVHQGAQVKQDSIRNMKKEHFFEIRRFLNEEEYMEGIKRAITVMTAMIDIVDGDSGYKVFHTSVITVSDAFSQQDIARMARTPTTIRMHSPIPVNFACLEMIGVEFDKIDMKRLKKYDNCFTGVVLDHMMKNKVQVREKWTELKIAQMMLGENITVEKLRKDGVSIEDGFVFFEEIEKFNVYAFDQFGNILQKSEFGGKNADGSRRRTARCPPLLFVQHDAHCYPITNEKKIATHLQRIRAMNAGSSQMFNKDKEAEKKKKIETATDLLTKRPYHFFEFNANTVVDDLDDYKDCNLFVSDYKNLYEMMIAIFQKEKFIYTCETGRGMVTRINYKNGVVIWANPNTSVANPSLDLYGTSVMSGKVCHRLGVDWKNQSIGAVTTEYVEKYFNPDLKSVRDPKVTKERKRHLERFSYTCQVCKVKDTTGKSLEVDHIVRVEVGGGNQDSNLQVVCKKCHDEKTRMECNIFRVDRTLSYYNSSTIDIFSGVKNGIIHNFVPYNEYARLDTVVDKDKKFLRRELHVKKNVILAGLDIQKCRTNILQYAMGYESFPVFSAMDDPLEFQPTDEFHKTIPVGEYFIVSKAICPNKGNEWCTHIKVKYMLKEKLITLQDIKWAIFASGYLPGNYYSGVVKSVLEKIVKHKVGSSAWKDEVFVAKQCINQWIGTMGIRVNEYSKTDVYSSLEAAATEAKLREDGMASTKKNFALRANESCRVFPKHFEGNKDKKKVDYYEVVTKSTKPRWDNQYPIFRAILDAEAVELHKIIRILQKFGGKVVNVNTDNAIAIFESQEQVDQMWKFAQRQYFDQERKVPKYKRGDVPSPNIVERMEEASVDVFSFQKPEYTVIEDPGHDNFKKFAVEVCDRLLDESKVGHTQIEGMAGTGKTTLTNCVIDELRKRDVCYVACAPTHVASRLLGKTKMLEELLEEHPKAKSTLCGRTLDATLSSCKYSNNFNALKKYKVCIIDEKSMVKSLFWSCLAGWKRTHPHVRFLLIGCWKQLSPVCDTSDSFDYENASIVHELSGGTMIHLTKCRRAADDDGGRALFEQYKDVTKMDLSKFGKKEQVFSIAYYNSTVNMLNQKWMNHFKPTNAALLKPISGAKEYRHCQDIYLYKGLPVIACVTREAMNLYNSEQWIVKSFNDKVITCESPDDKSETIELPRKDFANLVRPAYCITSHKSQGKTLRYPYSIYDWEKFNDRAKYVAISRGTTIDHVNIIREKVEKVVDKDANQGIQSMLASFFRK